MERPAEFFPGVLASVTFFSPHNRCITVTDLWWMAKVFSATFKVSPMRGNLSSHCLKFLHIIPEDMSYLAVCPSL